MSEIRTAQTEDGRTAVEEVMKQSQRIDISALPAEWVRVLVEDGVPVSFVAINPDRAIAFPKGTVRYAFICGGGTRFGRRGTGYFRRLLEATFDDLGNAGIPWIFGHAPYGLGRSLGFHVFSNHSHFILRPEEIEQTLGGGRPEGVEGMLSFDSSPEFADDLLLVTDVRAESENDRIQALREAAWTARSSGKLRIMFEQPPVAAPGSTYPIHEKSQTALLVAAMACGARVRTVGSEHAEEGDRAEIEGAIPEDMVKLLDLAPVVEQVLSVLDIDLSTCPHGSVAFDTEAGQATLAIDSGGWRVQEGMTPDALPVALPAEAVAQILIGYRSAETQAYYYQVEVAAEALQLLDHAFPRLWRFTRDQQRVRTQ